MDCERIDREAAVFEFLGEVPLLQRLPSSSLNKIADLVQVRYFDSGQHVVRKGEKGEGLYLIWDGKACSSGSPEVLVGNHSDIQLKQYDYFGYCTIGSDYEVNVIALSKLICLVLRHENSNLLHPKSIWNADETHEGIALVQHILSLEPQEVDIFHGHTLPEAPTFGHVFGGQLIGQALAAATKTVSYLKPVHSFHSYFLVAGETNVPIIYEVYRANDGQNFATRQVAAKQHGKVIFILVASFQKDEAGFEHHDLMPHVDAPETFKSIEELSESNESGPLPCVRTSSISPFCYHLLVVLLVYFLLMTFYQFSMQMLLVRKFLVSGPIDIRLCEPSNLEERFKPSLKYWLKVRGELSDEQALHRCALAFASDFFFGSISLKPHLRKEMKILALSLDHSIWFHRPVKADDWLLFSPSSCGGRGLSTGRMFNRKGELVMSLRQEALLREVKPTNRAPRAKM
ncbi:acyl-CoA thioesterase 2 [Dioscorea cayenensis subsp. rotundata]|uniref:Acyl-CoA thioesterase 2 n=1 Tax=Dioscorea cayennensis subsp. rotundata TaxID=55577 RepID=A0AB40CHP3_DIOCR|nr:acyl-CoA thioesterase 2 [Dioscorea cayenensis subsp. rotundata]